mgnify:CR=1 FL=1
MPLDSWAILPRRATTATFPAKAYTALRWGQPAYLAPKGSTLRVGIPKSGGAFALFAHCQTTLIADFREATGGVPTVGGEVRLEVLVLGLTLALACLPSVAIWTGFGVGIGRLLAGDPRRLRLFNGAMGLLLALSVILLFV